MFASDEVESLLKETRLKSISDIIKFIVDHVSKIINFDPIDQLSLRVSQLQRPKGLDRIMIQQVKALVQAMIDQRQNQFKKQIDKQLINIINGIQSKSINRKPLSQVDVINLLNNTQNSHRKNYKNQQQKKLLNDSLIKNIAQIKIQLQKKSDRRDVIDIRNFLARQLTNKISMKQTQKIINKFQQQIFQKINNNNIDLQKIQYNLKKSIYQQIQILKKDINDTHKNKQNKLIKQNKIQKKIKKIIQQIQNKNQYCIDKYQDIKKQIKIQKQQTYQQISQICQLVQNISNCAQNGKWIANGHLKGHCVVWEKQLLNSDVDLYMYEHRKTQIMVVSPGYYQISCYAFGCNKIPVVQLNSEPIIFLQFKNSSNQYVPNYGVQEIINISKSRSLLTIKFQGDDTYNVFLLSLKKI